MSGLCLLFLLFFFPVHIPTQSIPSQFFPGLRSILPCHLLDSWLMHIGSLDRFVIGRPSSQEMKSVNSVFSVCVDISCRPTSSTCFKSGARKCTPHHKQQISNSAPLASILGRTYTKNQLVCDCVVECVYRISG